MAELHILSATGSTVVHWEPRRGADVRQAQLAFEAGLRQGAVAYRCEQGRPLAPLDRFDPTASEIVLAPRLAGGSVSSDGRSLMTRAGMARLEEEVDRLRTVQRAALARRLQEAREHPGDQSDNLELLEAQQDLALLEARIAELEYALAQAQVAEERHGDSVEIGSVVVVRDEDGEEESYTLVGPAEADPRRGMISTASPVGRALLGARAGDRAVVETPAGARKLEVLKVA